MVENVSEEAKPGAILKQLRGQKGWTLADVSKRTGFPISTLSKIEKGQVSLSYDKLARISKGLDIDIGVFFARDGARVPQTRSGGRRSIIRKGEGRTIKTHSYLNQFLATDLLNKRFVPILGQGFVTSIEDFGEMIRHQGEEFCYVLEGSLELHTELYAPVTLEAGDAIYFDSGMGHAYISVGETPCKVLCICSGDESKLIGDLGTAEGLPNGHGERPKRKPRQSPTRSPSRKRAAITDTPLGS
ncbi:XRE family transcriptional regulator [Sphingomonas oligophenolica]